MRVEGVRTVAGDCEHVFARLLDPDTLGRALPGCRRLIQLGPPEPSGSVAFDAWMTSGRGVIPITIRVTAARPPAYLRAELRALAPTVALSAKGGVDLVQRDDHITAAYAFDVEGQGITAEAARCFAEITLARIADEGRDPADQTAHAAPKVSIRHAIQPLRVHTPRGTIATLPASEHSATEVHATPAWAQRAAWLGTGVLLGLSVIALTTMVARRLFDRDVDRHD